MFSVDHTPRWFRTILEPLGKDSSIPAECHDRRDLELNGRMPQEEVHRPAYQPARLRTAYADDALERVPEEPPSERRGAEAVCRLPLVVRDELRDW